MQKWLFRILVLILISTPMSTYGQKKKGQNPKKAAKEQLKKQDQNEKQGMKDLEKARKHHRKIQSKSTRKSMKRNKKRSNDHRERKDNIFRRIFG